MQSSFIIYGYMVTINYDMLGDLVITNNVSLRFKRIDMSVQEKHLIYPLISLI